MRTVIALLDADRRGSASTVATGVAGAVGSATRQESG